MNVIEMNDGRKVDYALRKTKLTFAEGALAIGRARQQNKPGWMEKTGKFKGRR